MSILSYEEIKEQILKSGFLVDYCENLTDEELLWWQDMCKAQEDHTRKEIKEELEKVAVAAFAGKKDLLRGFPDKVWQAYWEGIYD